MVTETSALSSLLTPEELDALLNTKEQSLSLLVQKASQQTPYPQIKKQADSFSRFLIPTLQKLTQVQNVAVSLQQFFVTTLGNFLDSIDSSAVLGIYTIEKIRQSCLVALDLELGYTLIDMRLGGRRGTAALQKNNRSYTQIEKNILCSFLTEIEKDLKDAFGESFLFENLNTTPQTALIASPACNVVIARLQLEIDNRIGYCCVVIPTHIISQIQPEQESCNVQSNDELAQALMTVPVTLKAVLDKKTIPFSQILKWKKGDVLDLSYCDNEPLEMMCANTTICKGKLTVDKKMFFITIENKGLE